MYAITWHAIFQFGVTGRWLQLYTLNVLWGDTVQQMFYVVCKYVLVDYIYMPLNKHNIMYKNKDH